MKFTINSLNYNIHELNFKSDSWTGRNSFALIVFTNAISGGQLSDSLIPAFDNLLFTHLKYDRLIFIARWVELFTIQQESCIVNLGHFSVGSDRTIRFSLVDLADPELGPVGWNILWILSFLWVIHLCFFIFMWAIIVKN